MHGPLRAENRLYTSASLPLGGPLEEPELAPDEPGEALEADPPAPPFGRPRKAEIGWDAGVMAAGATAPSCRLNRGPQPQLER
jgi:hypothetical protein